MSDTIAEIAAVFDRAAQEYDRRGVDFFGPAGQTLVDLVGVREGETILDVGCGRGASLIPAAQATGVRGHVTGIDISPGMVRLCQDTITAHGLSQARAEVADATDPDFPAGTFDAILAGFILFFLPDVEGALTAYRRLLRPGGRLAATIKPEDDPRRAAVQSAFDTAIGPYLDPAAGAPAAPTTALGSADQVAELLDRAGFTDIAFTDKVYPVSFADIRQFWQWSWSHGGRRKLERIPAGRRAEAEQAAVKALQPLLDDAGRLPHPLPVRFVTAARRS
jgi:ubiquinone/menaquinone biosynthesis C-methylase UbiE